MKRPLIAVSALSLALYFVPTAGIAAAPEQDQHVVLAGGCFWGMEAVFERLRGVKRVTAGYTGGAAGTANYEAVSTGSTGHAESIEIVYDPKIVAFRTLLDVYFHVAHNPTELDYQGPDHGSQYRSEIFYTTATQQHEAATRIAAMRAKREFSAPIVTRIEPLQKFYAAENRHQGYYDRHPDQPYIVYEDAPKVHALEARYPALLKNAPSR